ncbi:MAG: hypothetical protein IJI22_05495 [Bacilli bacterium]|nr:hypothetical protein [Bacilli bacterium]
MSIVKRETKAIADALQKPGVEGKRSITWNDIEDNNSLYDIAISKQYGKIKITKSPESEDYIRYGKAIFYEAEYDPSSDNFKIKVIERVLNPSFDGECTENVYSLEKNHNFLIKKYNGIEIRKNILDTSLEKEIEFYRGFNPDTKLHDEIFTCKLNSAGELVGGRYKCTIDKIPYDFLVNTIYPDGHIVIDDREIEKYRLIYNGTLPVIEKQINSGHRLVDYYIMDFITDMLYTPKDKTPSFKTKTLKDFEKAIDRKMLEVAKIIPLIELHDRILSELNQENHKIFQKS